MKKTVFAGLLAAAMVAQIGAGALAEDVEAGSLTSDSPVLWGIASFPFRAVTGVGGLGLGAIAGGLKGVVDTEKSFAENTFGKANENPFMIPVGLVGSLVAVPVGFVTGMPQQAVETGQNGYKWWDRF